MEKLNQVLKKKITDDLSCLLVACLVTIAVISTIVVGELFKNKTTEVSATPQNEIKNMEAVENLIDTSVTNTMETQKNNEKEEIKNNDKNKNNNISSSKYYIKVNYGAQVVTIYTKDSKGKYTKPVKAMVCSTGTYTPTSGVYKIPAKIRWCHMIGDVWGQYCSQVTGDILFHSVPYTTKGDHSSLMYNKYDQLGTKASLGCIRLTCADAKWIYDNCKVGTQVEFYSSSNPGPLGKPTARKIANAPSNIRGWDPTDPAQGNPWGEYLENLENKKEENNIANEVGGNVIENTVTENTIKNEIINNTIEIPEVNDTIINETVGNEIETNNTEVNIVNDTITNTEVNSIL